MPYTSNLTVHVNKSFWNEMDLVRRLPETLWTLYLND